MTTQCAQCGERYEIGDWPFCPHGKPVTQPPFKPYWDEHVSTKPVYVESLAQRRRLMRQNRFDYRGKKVGMPGCEV